MSIGTQFPLRDNTVFVLVDILHRVLDGHDASAPAIFVFIKVVDHRRHSGAFTAAGRPADNNHSTRSGDQSLTDRR